MIISNKSAPKKHIRIWLFMSIIHRKISIIVNDVYIAVFQTVKIICFCHNFRISLMYFHWHSKGKKNQFVYETLSRSLVFIIHSETPRWKMREQSSIITHGDSNADFIETLLPVKA